MWVKIIAIYALLVCKISGPKIWSCNFLTNRMSELPLYFWKAELTWPGGHMQTLNSNSHKTRIPSLCVQQWCWNYGRQLFSNCYHSNIIIIFAFKVPLYLCVQEINVENMGDNYFRCPPSRFQIPDRPPFHLIYCPNMRLFNMRNILWFCKRAHRCSIDRLETLLLI